MKLSDKILIVAKWLEAENNELLSEAGESQIDSLAISFVHAADMLREAAEEIAVAEPTEQIIIPVMTLEKLDELAEVAAAFDASGDELLIRQASVLDELLLTLSAPKDYIFNFKKAEDEKLDEIKKNYKNPKKELDENIGVKEALDDLKKSPVFKQYRPLEAPLSIRTCPDHPGAQMARIAQDQFQCSLDHKIYDYSTGYKKLDGTTVPGGSVSEQTPKFQPDGHQIFDHRDSRLGIHRE